MSVSLDINCNSVDVPCLSRVMASIGFDFTFLVGLSSGIGVGELDGGSSTHRMRCCLHDCTCTYIEAVKSPIVSGVCGGDSVLRQSLFDFNDLSKDKMLIF